MQKMDQKDIANLHAQVDKYAANIVVNRFLFWVSDHSFLFAAFPSLFFFH